jgi:transmembrane sensor
VENELNDIDDLIGKVLAGEAVPEDQIQLQNWIRVSEANQNYFNQIKTIFDRAAANQVQVQFDADAAWGRMKRKLRGSKEGKTRSILSFENWSPLRIAAGILFISVVGMFAYKWLNPPTETFIAVSEKATVQDTLPDGSSAFLNKRSTISYEYNPKEKIRKVKLKGESFFDVKHEEERPFVIEAEEVLVRDIGTAFNVKAYPESDTVEVIVQSGEVQIYTVSNPGLYLTAGETGFYSKRLREFSKIVKADTNALAYKTGIFSFNNTDLKSLISKVNEVYDAHITLANPKLENCHITVSFNNDKLDTIVEVIAETLNLTVTRKEKEIFLDGTGCQ